MVKENKYEIKDDDVFDKLISDAFQYKRKTIKNNLKGYDLNKYYSDYPVVNSGIGGYSC